MGFYDELIEAMNASLKDDFDGKTSHMGKACGVHPSTLKRLLEGERSTWAQALGRIADAANIRATRGAITKATTTKFTPSTFDSELCEYVNGLIRIQKKKPDEVAKKASPDNSIVMQRIQHFLTGKGPLWASDLPLLATVLNQQPEELLKTVTEMVNNVHPEDSVQQTLAG